MSFEDNNGQQGSGGNPDIVIQLQSIVSQLSALVQAFSGRLSFGTFTLGAAATTVVQNTAVKGNSYISWVPSNAAASALEGSAKCLYKSTVAAGASFTVATGNAVAAAGTETYDYIIISPS